MLEPAIVQALYRASQAGVRIDLICRGICSLRPNVPGISDHIRVISIVDRFLEHSRIFYFGNDGDPDVYIGSADWMDRNLSRRVEVVFPIEPVELKQRLIREILATSLADNAKARLLLPDGRYERIKPVGQSDARPQSGAFLGNGRPKRGAAASGQHAAADPLRGRASRPRPPPPQTANELKKS